MVTGNSRQFAAEVYKAYLNCAARIIRAEGGVITAYDGDRIMAVFIGDTKNTPAARAALKINHAVRKIINPKLWEQYPGRKGSFEVSQVVGVDTGELLVARTGIRGSNDLVWVGRPANYAAKLCDIRDGYSSWITGDVYNNMHDSMKSYNGRDVWERRTWTTYNIPVYRSNWTWNL
jgi:class 3 adenylate cyclase